jgi:hypothetical protein
MIEGSDILSRSENLFMTNSVGADGRTVVPKSSKFLGPSKIANPDRLLRRSIAKTRGS